MDKNEIINRAINILSNKRKSIKEVNITEIDDNECIIQLYVSYDKQEE